MAGKDEQPNVAVLHVAVPHFLLSNLHIAEEGLLPLLFMVSLVARFLWVSVSLRLERFVLQADPRVLEAMGKCCRLTDVL